MSRAEKLLDLFEKEEFVRVPLKTKNAKIVFNKAGLTYDFEIKTSDGSYVNGYLKEADFTGEYGVSTRGELFYIEVKSKKRKGVGTSLVLDMLRTMKANGVETVVMTLRSTKDGKEFIDNLVQKKYISKPIKVGANGKTEHTILIK